jgi:hypothetical protein
MSSRFNHEPSDHHEPHPWLEEKVYAKLRQRTVDLVKQSVDALCKDKQQHRSWRGSSRKRAKPLVVVPPAPPPGVKPGRDEQRVRQRYLRMSKEALVARLITAERTLAEQRDRWLAQQDEVLTWRLRAEAAEAQLQDEKETANRQKK